MTTFVTDMTHSLKATDRCDTCGAHAFVRVGLITGELVFCGHHYAASEAALAHVAITIDDRRESINLKP